MAEDACLRQGAPEQGEEVNNILRYFEYDHLTDWKLRAVSKRFYEIAVDMAEVLPNGLEKSTALRKLLEAKDCAVRSALDL